MGGINFHDIVQAIAVGIGLPRIGVVEVFLRTAQPVGVGITRTRQRS